VAEPLYTNHILLVGAGAKGFALSYGFKDEDVLTPKLRAIWPRWPANRGNGDDWLDLNQKEELGSASPVPSRYAAREAKLLDPAYRYRR